MCGFLSVIGMYAPPVTVEIYLAGSGIYHRFDAYYHAVFEFYPIAALAVIRHARSLMHLAAYAMTLKFPDD